MDRAACLRSCCASGQPSPALGSVAAPSTISRQITAPPANAGGSSTRRASAAGRSRSRLKAPPPGRVVLRAVVEACWMHETAQLGCGCQLWRVPSRAAGRFGISRPSSKAHTAGPSSRPSSAASRSPRAAALSPAAARRVLHRAIGPAPLWQGAGPAARQPGGARAVAGPLAEHARDRRAVAVHDGGVRAALERPARGAQAEAQVGVTGGADRGLDGRTPIVGPPRVRAGG